MKFDKIERARQMAADLGEKCPDLEFIVEVVR